jgi:WD40 repeat protein
MPDRVGQQLGNYHLLRPLGQGGFADVYLGEHVYLHTQAAIKVLQMRLTEEDKHSFLHEAQTIARLKHPSIVRVLEYDVIEGIPFLVMDFAPNGTLRQYHPKGIVLRPSVVVPYVKQIAAALQHAHEQKLIHRDVKPENMLLMDQQTVLLSDFGLAVIIQSSRDRLQTVAGTVTYMAPEQLQGRPSPASDQYALAIVIYEWLSGERLFSGSFIEVATQHVLVPPPSLRSKQPSLSYAIDMVVQKALAKDPEQRFPSVAEFATAFEQACAAAQVTRPVISSTPPIGKLYTTYRKHTAAVFDLAWSPDSRKIASASADKTVHIWNAGSKNPTHIYREHSRAVYAVAWSSDGNRIASGSADTTVQVWHPQSGRRYFTYRGFSREVSAVAWSPRDSYLAAGSWDATIQVRQSANGSKLLTYQGHSSPVHTLAWSPATTPLTPEEGWRIVSASGDPIHANKDNTVQIWRVHPAQQSAHAQPAPGAELLHDEHFHYVCDIAWSPDGTKLASASADTSVHIWDAQTGSTILTYRGHSSKVNAVTWSPDGQRIASASDDGTVQVWQIATGETILTYRGHTKEVQSVAWAPNGKRIASAGNDATVQVWQAE